MTIEKAKELQPIITHFAKGGNLWTYTETGGWVVQSEICLHGLYNNIIEDKFFEARKAYALGEKIESMSVLNRHSDWEDDANPDWTHIMTYRIKPKEPVYEWQYYSYSRVKREWYLTKYHTEDELSLFDCMVKFEPSKRLKQ